MKTKITDTGPGIASQYVAKLFSPFEQPDAGMKTEGTGLGLAICKEYTRMMNWEIPMESKAGSGSTFCIDVVIEEVNPFSMMEKADSHRVVGLKASRPSGSWSTMTNGITAISCNGRSRSLSRPGGNRPA